MHFIIFFGPFVLAYLVKDPILSYMISWGGSLFLLLYSNYINYLKSNKKIRFFSPLVLGQGLLWGYTAITSIFYFLDNLGYEFFEKVGYPNTYVIEDLAKSQNIIVLAHAAYLTGFFFKKIRQISPEEQQYQINIFPEDYLKISIYATGLAFVISFTPFAQLSSYLAVFSTICAVKYFGYALSYQHLAFKGFLYFAGIMILGFLSGMKENTLFPLIYLAIILFDKYGVPKTSAFFLPLIVLYFYFIPTMNVAIRQASWYGNMGAVETLSTLQNDELFNEERIKNNNWEFLCTRMSEISMLNIYIESVPKNRPYYEFEIIKYGIQSMVPRFLWPGKLSPDVTAQRRAIENGALTLNNANDFTSAKPQTIADAYMSFGYISVVFIFVLFGFLAHYFAYILELKLGYEIGLSILYYSLFAVLTKGGCFENLFNTTFFGYILIFVAIKVLSQFHYIERKF